MIRNEHGKMTEKNITRKFNQRSRDKQSHVILRRDQF